MGLKLFEFPVGYHRFHRKQLYNYQLNRWYSLGYLSYDDVKSAGEKIDKFTDWKSVMIENAEGKLKDNKFIEAAFFFRAAEFYTLQGQEDKELLYDKFIDLFYSYMPLEGVYVEEVPYRESFIHILKMSNKTENKKGTILIHIGFDSFIEEFYSLAWYFAIHGYEVIAFDGPGQGKTLKKFNIPFDFEWEKPIKTILDYYEISEAALLGISLGGYLCLRAAAFEPRIKWVISTGGAYDYYKIPPLIARCLMDFFKKYMREGSNKAALKGIQKGGMEGWRNSNIMYITKIDVPMDAFEYAWQMNSKNMHANEIRQDVMVITGKDDHLIPFKLHAPLIKSLTNAKSVTDIVFTKKNYASNHCSIGNIKLSLDTMINWLDSKIN
ncbi:Pimeloyl-ACP methyl ester carboxylesterase [Natronincola peptidivorans]|uniref:Pimeloyl-ACP methyl ester carboxylesterase n=1 Tax=Natronincola peptidivorans TaxID=426128 RepID=A0A1I0EDP8_9FIRM|nr:alpha/beta hydrolase [Natronincola peptidivorans]SET43349.1 Pimeloyl-ACP methyl ester carboxylesterase [Natronincola peptidivorans]